MPTVTTDRLLPRMLRTICEKRGIHVASFSDDWLFELSKDGQTARIVGYAFGLNSAVAAKIAQDKVVTYELLKHYDIPAVEHRLIRVANSDWRQWPWNDGWVIKPLLGMSGNGVGVVRSSEAAAAWMNAHGDGAWAAAPLLDIVREIRVIVLDGRAMLSYEKVPIVQDGLKFFNLGRGATPKDIALPEAVETLAKSAVQAAGLRLAAADIIELPTGEFKVLELNDGFATDYYAHSSTTNRERAEALYDAVIAAMFA